MYENASLQRSSGPTETKFFRLDLGLPLTEAAKQKSAHRTPIMQANLNDTVAYSALRTTRTAKFIKE